MPTVSDTEIIVVTDVPLLSSIEGAIYQTKNEKGQPDGYASLDADGLVPSSQLPVELVQSVNGQIGIINLTAADVDAVSSVNGKTGQSITLDSTDVGAIPFTDKGSPNGVATLDGSGKVSSSQLSTSVSDATNMSKGVIQLDGDLGGTAVNPTVPGLATKENVANKGQANGYASLDGNGHVPGGQLVGVPVFVQATQPTSAPSPSVWIPLDTNGAPLPANQWQVFV